MRIKEIEIESCRVGRMPIATVTMEAYGRHEITQAQYNVGKELSFVDGNLSSFIFTANPNYQTFNVKDIIFNYPATIIIWADNTKTVVKCSEEDEFSKEKGIALCFMKKAMGNGGRFNNVLKKYAGEEK